MATNHDHDEYDLLKNPAVDYDRSDLSARGILVFLAGLLIAGIFVEVVLGGMFHFLARSPFFAKGNPNPMVIEQKTPPLKAQGADFENSRNINPEAFPQPRLQTDDARDMTVFLDSERKLLYAEQPFADQGGTVHLPINEAMKLVVDRGLPVKPAGEVAPVASKAVTPTAKAAPSTKETAAQ